MIEIFITTSSRPEWCLDLLKQIENESAGLAYQCRVWHDRKEGDEYDEVEKYCKEKINYHYYKTKQHMGKERFWLLNNLMYKYLDGLQYQYFIQLPDDIRLVRNFMPRALQCVQTLDICNIFTLNGMEMNIRHPKTIDNIQMFQSNWVDCAFVAKRCIMYGFQVEMPLLSQFVHGSGVGHSFIQSYNKKTGLQIWQVTRSLIQHLGYDNSIMHERQIFTGEKHPLKALLAPEDEKYTKEKPQHYSTYHNGRVAWGLDTSYAGYPFIAKYLDCKTMVWNRRLPYWDEKVPLLIDYITHPEIVYRELKAAKELYLFGAMGVRYLLPLLDKIGKKLKDYKVVFLLTDHWFIRDPKQNGDRIGKSLRECTDIEMLVMPDLIHYIQGKFKYKPYYQHIPITNGIEVKNKIFTVAHSPGLKKDIDHKGTSIIEKVCKELGINLDIISGISWEQSIQRKKKAHIFFDQIITDKTRTELGIDYKGGIGKSGLEAMKCGCVTICSGKFTGTKKQPVPPVDIVNNEIELKALLKKYIKNKAALKKLAQKQKAYVDKYTSFDFVLKNTDSDIIRIEQIRTSKAVSFFEPKMIDKYGLKQYTDKSKPAVFFGMYRAEDYEAAIAHKGNIVYLWAGTDATYLQRCYFKYIPQLKGRHIAFSVDVQKRLATAGLEAEFIPITPTKIIKDVQPKGDCVYFYGKGNNYGEQYLEQIRSRIPYKIIHATSNTFTAKELKEVYKKCFIGLRLTPSDGMPNTVIELGLMGRRCIYNSNPLPNAIKYTDIDSIVSIINNEKEEGNKNNEAIAENIEKYFSTYDDFWLYTKLRK